MADPQVEDGYTRIANELFEAIYKFPFTIRQLRIVLFFIRQTYGHHLKMKQISLARIEAEIGMPRTHICKVINDLARMGVLLKQSHPVTKSVAAIAQTVGINKNYEEWMSLAKPTAVTNSVTVGVTNSVTVPYNKVIKEKDPPLPPKGGAAASQKKSGAWLVKRWNDFAEKTGAPKSMAWDNPRFPASRKKTINTQLKSQGFDWEELLTIAFHSKFIRDAIATGKRWFDLSFVLKPVNQAKMLEGKYSDQPAAGSGGGTAPEEADAPFK